MPLENGTDPVMDATVATEEGARHDRFAELSAAGPAHRTGLRNGSPAWLITDHAGYDAYATSATNFLTYFHKLIAEKRRTPGEDIISDLVAVRDGSDRLSEDELTSMVYLLVIAGHETTVNLIANATFSHGIHYCLGAPPARLEGRMAIAALFGRFPEMTLAVPAGTLSRTPSMIMNGLVTLPVHLRSAE